VELGASKQKLQPGKSGEYGRRRIVLLFRNQLASNETHGFKVGVLIDKYDGAISKFEPLLKKTVAAQTCRSIKPALNSTWCTTLI